MKKRKLRRSEWIIILAPLLAFAAVGGGPLWQRLWHRYFPVQLKGHVGYVSALGFSEDGRHLLVASSDGSNSPEVREVRLWDLKTRSVLWKAKQADWASWPQFSKDSRYVGWVIQGEKLMPDAEGGFADALCEIYDVNTGTLLSQIPLSYAGTLFRFLPDNRHIMCNGTKVRVWDLQTGKLVRTLSRDAWPISRSWLPIDKSGRFVAVVAQGKRLPLPKDIKNLPGRIAQHYRAGVYRKGKLRVYEIATGKLLAQSRDTLPEETEVVRFRGYGKEVEVFVRGASTPGAILTWVWQTEGNFKKMEGPDGSHIRTSPDGKTRICALFTRTNEPLASPSAGSTIQGANTQTQTPLWTMKIKGFGRRILFFPNSRHFAVYEYEAGHGSRWISVRETQTGKEIKRFKGSDAFMPSPDGKTLATSAQGVVKLWDVSDLALK